YTGAPRAPPPVVPVRRVTGQRPTHRPGPRQRHRAEIATTAARNPVHPCKRSLRSSKESCPCTLTYVRSARPHPVRCGGGACPPPPGGPPLCSLRRAPRPFAPPPPPPPP